MTRAIRPAEPEDAAEIARLGVALGYDVTTRQIEQRLQALADNENSMIVVCGNPGEPLLGWVAAELRILLHSGRRVEIVGMIVDPEHQRQGIGLALLNAVESWASSLNVGSIVVRSNTAREASHRFYARVGFTETKTQRVYRKQTGSR